jgi:signal transduction histidine kinase
MFVVAGVLAALTLAACAALKLVTDVMASRAEQLVQAVEHGDREDAINHILAIETWSRAGDYIAWSVATVVFLGTVGILAFLYSSLFQPMFGLAKAMRRFTAGDRDARAERSRGVEVDAAAKSFNSMADIITGQHTQMLDFLGGAAEELRDPVQSIKAAIKCFVPGRPLPPEQMIWARVALVSREANRLEQLVQAYLDASRVQWKRLDLQLGRHDLRAIVRDAATMYRSFSPVHQVEISLPSEPMMTDTNPVRAGQVVHTLVANAIQRSPRGGVVEVVLRRERDDGVLEVIDHGIGIPEDQLKTLFEPFKNLSLEHGKGPGAAVSMSVMKRIVEALGGKIEVTSKVGQGSTFRVRVPLPKERTEEAAEKERTGKEEREGRERGEREEQRAVPARPPAPAGAGH